MKKLINKPEDVVSEELEGIVVAHSGPGQSPLRPQFRLRGRMLL